MKSEKKQVNVMHFLPN